MTKIEDYIDEYEEDYDLISQDTKDGDDNLVAARIVSNEDETKTHYHFHRGEPYNLYEKAHNYTIDQNGIILFSERIEECELEENDDTQHGRFVHLYHFYHNVKTLSNEAVQLKSTRENSCSSNLSSLLIERMGLN